MGYRLREIAAESKFSQELTLDAISQAVPLSEVKAALAAEAICEQRERKLNMVVTVLVLIALNLYARISIGAVLSQVAKGLRYIWPEPDYAVAKANAFSYRRYQLGARPLANLFHRVCQPMATPETVGAFLCGLRLMAIDGSIEDVADTPENGAVFGRHAGDRGDSAFPQVQTVYLVECGTHAIVDAGFWPCHTSERVGGFRMLRSVQADMLVLWDRGFHDFDMFQSVLRRHGQALGRLPASVQPKRIRTLPDGSYLALVFPSERQRRQHGEHLVLRIIEYTLTDPALPGFGERYRLATTLLDHTCYPAFDLACCYHERWEVELVIDETDDHQRLAGRPLRSLKPVGVIQELYALLIAHYAVRKLMHDAALQANVDPDRLSFTHALQVVQDAIAEFQMTAPDLLPELYRRMLRDIAALHLPKRRMRSNPRVVKRKMSKFRLKRTKHQHWPQPTCSFEEAVQILKHSTQHEPETCDALFSAAVALI